MSVRLQPKRGRQFIGKIGQQRVIPLFCHFYRYCSRTKLSAERKKTSYILRRNNEESKQSSLGDSVILIYTNLWWPRSIFFRFRFRPHGGRLRFRPYGGRFRLLGHHSYNMSRRRSGRREVGIGIGHHRVGIGVGRHEVGIGIGKIYFSATICFTALTNVFEPFQNVQKIIVTCEPQNGHAGTNFAGDWRVLDWSKLLSRARNLFLKTSSVNAK